MSEPQLPAEPRAFVTAAVLLLGALTIMSNATIAPALPALKQEFLQVPQIDTLAGLVITLPSLAIILSAGLFGWLADRYDRQVLLAVAGLLYAAGGTSGLWVESLSGILIGRAVLGVGVAGTMTLAMLWATDLWLGPARARFMGRQGAAMSAGGIVVMLAGGALASLHWRAAFAVYALALPVAALALVALAPYARRLAGQRRSAAPAGAGSEPFPWPVFGFVGGLAFLFMAVFYVLPTRLPFHLGNLGVTSPFAVGAIMASLTVAALPGALNYGRLRQVLSPMAVFALSWAAMGAGMLIIGLADGPAMVVAGSVVAGLGMGPAMPNYSTYLMSFVPAAQRGRASGLLTTAFFAGQFVAPLLAAPLVAGRGLAGAFEALGAAQLVLAAGLALAATRVRAPA